MFFENAKKKEKHRVDKREENLLYYMRMKLQQMKCEEGEKYLEESIQRAAGC